MKKTAILLAALLTTGASLFADTAAAAPAAPSSSWVFTPAFTSQYMFRGVRLGGPSFQPTLEFDQGSLAVGVWASTPISAKVDGQSDPEFDFYGTYSFEVAKDMTLVPGFTFYTYPDANKANGFYKGTFEPNLAFNYTISGWKFTPKVYYDFVLKGPTLELTAAYAIPLPDIKSELDFTASAGTFKWTDALENTTPKAKNWGDYYSVGVAMPFQVSTGSKLTLGVAYTKGSNNYVKIGTDHRFENTAAVGRAVFTLSYAISF